MSSRLMKQFHFHPACCRQLNVPDIDREGSICDPRHEAKIQAFAEARRESVEYRTRTFCQLWRRVESGAGLT